MARSVYITGLEPGGGKSGIALGVCALLSRRVEKLAAFRPLAREASDPIVDLVTATFPGATGAYGMTYAEAAALLEHGDVDAVVARVVDAYLALAADRDAVVIVGTDYGRDSGDADDGRSIPDELTFNARVANECGAAVIAVVDGARPAGDLALRARTAYHSLVDQQATVAAVIANRVPADMAGPLALGVDVPAYAVPLVPSVAAPALAQVAEALHATVLTGAGESMGRDVNSYVVGGAHVPIFLDHLRDGALVLTPGDRADLILAAAAAHVAGHATIAGIVLTLGVPPDPGTLALVAKLNPGFAILSVAGDSFETVTALKGLEGRLTSGYPRKVEAAIAAFEDSVDIRVLTDRLAVARSARVTPMMFEYGLISRARAARRHVVLPEGAEERILRAADVLIRRDVCELTLLGDPDAVARKARELGLDIGAAHLVDPGSSPWRAGFAAEYAKLRAHKGVPLDAAYDLMAEPNYFGTMMVHTGRADAMVSGATHPTADTIRPAFEIIKTTPDVSIASSVFFMCLPDQVLVYGDCAINPDPDPAQLADIALSSARTAAAFGVDPRVAMLSYSTGVSGHGADVDKVAEATALVRARAPHLPVEGPIQYDAAVDPSVAATKLPGSEVAGRATVFIFPDLNTGNNTYKAVQRSARAVAVGPVMQGLRKPVNDLSRGATVADIVNTVAITAIQASTTTPPNPAPAPSATAAAVGRASTIATSAADRASADSPDPTAAPSATSAAVGRASTNAAPATDGASTDLPDPTAAPPATAAAVGQASSNRASADPPDPAPAPSTTSAVVGRTSTNAAPATDRVSADPIDPAVAPPATSAAAVGQVSTNAASATDGASADPTAQAPGPTDADAPGGPR